MNSNRVRRIVQAVAYLLFLYLWIGPASLLSPAIPSDFFFRIDPLLALGILLATRTFSRTILWAVGLLLATLIGGRFFCGWVCPLGTTLDLFDRVLGGEKSLFPLKPRYLKYYLLTLLLTSSLFGLTLFLYLDPLSLWSRTLTLVFYPLAVFFKDGFSSLLGPVLAKAGIRWCKPHLRFLFDVRSSLLALGIFGFIVLLGKVERRFWCRNLCPLGALLGLISRLSLFSRRVNPERCERCSLCVQVCPTGAIGEDFRLVPKECIQCGSCSSVCPSEAIEVRIKSGFPSRAIVHNPLRRAFLFSGVAGVGIALALFARLKVFVAGRVRLLRPPGSLPEKEFLDRCIRCGECLRVCPTGGLQPCLEEAGFEGFGTPRLVPRRGGCERECNLCGVVCPTGAIRRLSLAEKQSLRLGIAIIDRSRCIAWSQGKVCLICAQVCPYQAIELRFSSPRPYVLEEKCRGCGLCEQRCPVEGEAAIVVYPEEG